MFSSRTRTTCWLFALTLALLVAPGSAEAAAQPTVWALDPFPSFESGGVTITGTDAPDSITVSFDTAANEYLVSDESGLTPLSPCEGASMTVVRCPNLAPYVKAFLGDGDDHLVADVSLGTVESFLKGEAGDDLLEVRNIGGGYLWGAAGNDHLIGGPGPESLYGRRGRDEIAGGPFEDYIIGGRGADTLVGGGGSDHLRADDHERDIAIRCGGSAKDEADIDRDLDPMPRGCPHIHG